MLSEKTLNYLKLSFEERLKLEYQQYYYPLYNSEYLGVDLETRLKTDLDFQEKLLHTKIKFLRELLDTPDTSISNNILKAFSKNVFFDIKDYIAGLGDYSYTPCSFFKILFVLNANITKTQLEEIKYFCEYFENPLIFNNIENNKQYHNYLDALNNT